MHRSCAGLSAPGRAGPVGAACPARQSYTSEQLEPVDCRNRALQIIGPYLWPCALWPPARLANPSAGCCRGCNRQHARCLSDFHSGPQWIPPNEQSCFPVPWLRDRSGAPAASRMTPLSGRPGLPALMQLLGHKDIRMTLRYVQVTQQDLQREFHKARQHAAQPHPVPVLAVPNCPTSADPPGIRQAIAATRHLLEMYRRGLADEKTRRRLRRLDQRLLKVALQLDPSSPKMERTERSRITHPAHHLQQHPPDQIRLACILHGSRRTHRGRLHATIHTRANLAVAVHPWDLRHPPITDRRD